MDSVTEKRLNIIVKRMFNPYRMPRHTAMSMLLGQLGCAKCGSIVAHKCEYGAVGTG
jgi:hypothetical protein